MDNMIEIIARTLCANNSASENGWRLWAEDAVLVLKVIRNPTTAMLAARDSSDSLESVWPLMVDAALSGDA